MRIPSRESSGVCRIWSWSSPMATAHDELQMWLQTPTEGQELSLSLGERQILIEPAQ